jgi:hypothetical protein
LRRLAKQRREDDYASRRDYQAIQERQSLRIAGKSGLRLIQLKKPLIANDSNIGGFGGYVRAATSVEVSAAVMIDGSKLLAEWFIFGNKWSRVGLAFPLTHDADCTVQLQFSRPINEIEVWGLDAGPFAPPKLKRNAIEWRQRPY